MLKHLLLYVVYAGISIGVFGQQAKQYVFTHFSTGNGLVTNIVNGITQDYKGYIWFATVDGLQRYDGNNFLTFRSESTDPTSLPSDNIKQVFADKKKNLWVWAGDDIGIFNTSNFSFRRVPIQGETDKEKFLPLFLGISDTGSAAIYVYDRGVYKYNPQQQIFKAAGLFKFPKDWNLYLIRSFSNDHRIFFSGLYGLSIFNFKTGHINYRGHNPDNDIFVNSLAKDTAFTDFFRVDGSKLWYGTWPLMGGLFVNYIDAATNERKHYRITEELGVGYIEILGGMKQQNGQLWLYGTRFVAGLTGEENHPFFLVKNEYRNEQSIDFDVARNMFEDRQHNVWIATDNGVFVFDPDAQSFKNYRLLRPGETEGTDGPTTSACELKDGRIFIGTWGRGLFCYDKHFDPVPLPPELQIYYGPYSIWCIHQHSITGQVWMGMQGGEMLVYDPARHTSEKLNDTFLQHSTIRQVTEDHAGNLWFAMQGGQIVKWDMKKANGDFHKGYSLIKTRDKAYPWKLFTDKDGYIWMASVAYGLFKLDPTTGKQIDHFTRDGPQEKGYGQMVRMIFFNTMTPCC